MSQAFQLLVALAIPVSILVAKGFYEKRKFEKTACVCYHSPGRHFHRTGFCYSCHCKAYEPRNKT